MLREVVDFDLQPWLKYKVKNLIVFFYLIWKKKKMFKIYNIAYIFRIFIFNFLINN
jgi:hypothetical protein